MIELKGRKILFIGIGFYDYEACIAEELRKQGATVTYICENHDGSLIRAIASRLKVGAKLDRWYSNRHLGRCLNQKSDFDEVFVIKGQRLTPQLMQLLRCNNPKAKFRLYQWDSIERFEGDLTIFSFFDRVFTFDRDDHIRKGFEFRPLFFRSKCSGRKKKRYDVSFVGWLHFDRLEIVQRLFRELEVNGCITKCHIYTSFKKWVRLLMLGRVKGVKFRPIPYEVYSDILDRSGAILDLPHPNQSGLTMRTIESVGAHRKIVTTNEDIQNYDFYSPNNILILNELTSVMDIIRFLDLDFEELDSNIVERYSIESWLRSIFGNKQLAENGRLESYAARSGQSASH